MDAPIRTPVNEPGPEVAASIDTSEIFLPDTAKRFSTIGIRVALCVIFALRNPAATVFPSSTSAHDAETDEVSSDSISNFYPPSVAFA